MNKFYYSLPTHYKLTTKVLQTSTNLYSSTRVWLRNPEFADAFEYQHGVPFLKTFGCMRIMRVGPLGLFFSSIGPPLCLITQSKLHCHLARCASHNPCLSTLPFTLSLFGTIHHSYMTS